MSICSHGVVINPTRLDEYHPAWVLNANQEKELEWRKEGVIHDLEQMVNDLNNYAMKPIIILPNHILV